MRSAGEAMSWHTRGRAALDGVCAGGSPFVDLAIRLWIAGVVWQSGLGRILSWNATLALFASEYRVPWLSPAATAALAIAGELVFPVLLVFGLFTRGAALGLVVVNVAAIAWSAGMPHPGPQDRLQWLLLLLVPLFHGPGRLSIDHLLGPILQSRTVTKVSPAGAARVRSLHEPV